jgi:hypothetical protein
MYEYKIFGMESSSASSVQYLNYETPDMNKLLEDIAKKGWEPVQVDYYTQQILAKRLKTLND